MPDLAIHLSISIFILIFFLGINLKYYHVFILLPAGIVLDIDSFIFIHRATFHNIFLVLLLIFIFFLIKKYKWFSGPFMIAVVLISIHIVLDMAYNGVFLFFPLSDLSIHLGGWLGITAEQGVVLEIDHLIPGTTSTIDYVIDPAKLPSGRIPIVENGVEFTILGTAIAFLLYRLAANQKT